MRMVSSLAAAVLLSAMPLTAHAQPKPTDDHGHHPGIGQPAPEPPPGGMGMMGGPGMGRMMPTMQGGMMMGGMPFQHIEGRLAFLKAELKITPAQEPQWTKFADVVRSTAKSAADGMRPMMMGGMMQGGMMQGGGQAQTALDVFNRYEKTLTIRLEAVRAVKGAFEPLYGVLSDEQKKMANELLASPMGIM